MKIKKGDNVKILAGKDRGKTGKVIKVFPEIGKIAVEGINLYKKHKRPKREGEKGEIVLIPKSMDASNAALVCFSCQKPSRFGFKCDNEKKVKFCKKCKAEIE